MSPFKTVLVLVGGSPFAAYLAAVIMNGVLNHRAGRKRDPKLAAAIARHPSSRTRALYPPSCCGLMLAGDDPLDLVAAQLLHESTCLDARRAA